MIRLKIPVSLQLSHNGDTLLVPYLQNLLHMNLWCVKAWLWDIFLLLLIVSFITRHTISKEQKKKKKHTFRDLLNRRFLSSINETSCIRSISVPVPDAVVHELRQVESALVFLPALFMVPCCEHCGAPAVLCWFITSDCGEDCEPWRRFITQWFSHYVGLPTSCHILNAPRRHFFA